MSDVAAISLATRPVDRPAKSVWDRLDRDEKLFLSYQIILLELFLLTALWFGFGGVIVFAKVSAVVVLALIVAFTSVDLFRKRVSIPRTSDLDPADPV